MRRPIGWIDKNFPDGPREIRVSFHADAIRWQFRAKNAEEWDAAGVPSEEDWLVLEQKILELMQRGHLFQRELELVRRRSNPKSGSR